ncbi:MAG: hypothetical protein UT48_C0018G0018 [Parcubacteria group bacterium GW2011_GWE2_39_37]|uniref:DUF1361 domain-containing protein n=1 Tax=Candidatus Falkowbacteria bacterium GW2011_GWF2_39_8 TaxID=1618642 RepID=A0A0G0Q0Q4_9BACT|nr:MAG: hypothetical protein UT48_C0018G0018 [Parcubacteria group bacterium GW2011_GWE2_39_37]KKR30941.1 MAG: hypothetical protein UT64_C0079G0002 [Candidatus Falkowbacteria bacterium GW2011_GWF2_39_8]
MNTTIERYINSSKYSVDNFFQDDRWLYHLKINNYQVVTIIWNLFLIIVPFVICYLLIKYWQKNGFRTIGQKLMAFLLFFFWLLFIPNTAYIISEVRHLIDYCPRESKFQVCEQNAWMSLFFFTYSAIGWVTFVLLINQMKSLIKNVFGKIVANLFILVIIPVIALGFLIGLLNRWNSWELFIYPVALYKNLMLYFTVSGNLANLIIFSAFLYLLYYSGNYLFKNRIS